ncbi:hypothetical protein [Paenibacillus uliginis]|nr:hypothetical protein [Paenibacillus uliginis]
MKPLVLKLIASIDSRFIQDYINPVSYRNIYNKYFWEILINSLGIQAQSISINTITSNYENFKMIEHIKIDEYQKALLICAGHNINLADYSHINELIIND